MRPDRAGVVNVESRIIFVKCLRQLGVLTLLLMISLAPAMACMAPNAQMTTQERACCRMMKGDCGQMEMPASHGCCQKAPGTVHDTHCERIPLPSTPLCRSFTECFL